MNMPDYDWEREEFIERARIESCFVLRIPPGQNVIKRLEALMQLKEARRAAIISGIGSVCDVTFRNLKEGIEMPINKDKIMDVTRKGPFELLSLEGNLVPMGGNPVIHLHAILGTPDGTLVGGHLFDATVFATVELFVAEIGRSFVIKARDERTGMAEMQIAEPTRFAE